jgi:uncharacterized protein YegL
MDDLSPNTVEPENREPSLLEAVEFADNPEPRCPVVLVLDCSASMTGEPIDELNEGLRAFSESIKKDELASLRVEVAVVSFGPVRVMDVHAGGGALSDTTAPGDVNQAFATAIDFQPPLLTATDGTPMGEAVETALKLVRERKVTYKTNGIDYFRPWIFLITDGYPTDGLRWQNAAEQVKQEEERKGVIFFGIGVEKADMQKLAQFSAQRPPVKLRGLAFGELFQWLSKSVTAVAQAKPGDQVPLPPVSWGAIDTSS